MTFKYKLIYVGALNEIKREIWCIIVLQIYTYQL